MTLASASRAIDAIVVGGSAGSVEVLSVLLPALQPACGVPVLVVVHLPRERPSQLAQLFSSKCRLRVVEAEDKLPLEPGVLYCAPPDYHLLVDAGPQLALSGDPPVHYSRPSLDVLFDSAADIYGATLLGIVLSGANADGAAGLRNIARAGGLAWVQRPETAGATAMPRAALDAAPGAVSLSPAEMAQRLAALEAGKLRSRQLP